MDSEISMVQLHRSGCWAEADLWAPATTGISIRFDRLNRRELAVYVWFCARGA